MKTVTDARNRQGNVEFGPVPITKIGSGTTCRGLAAIPPLRDGRLTIHERSPERTFSDSATTRSRGASR